MICFPLTVTDCRIKKLISIKFTFRKLAGKTAFELASQKPSLDLIITKLAAYEASPSASSAMVDGGNGLINVDQVPHLKRNKIATCHNVRKLSSRYHIYLNFVQNDSLRKCCFL